MSENYDIIVVVCSFSYKRKYIDVKMNVDEVTRQCLNKPLHLCSIHMIYHVLFTHGDIMKLNAIFKMFQDLLVEIRKRKKND